MLGELLVLLCAGAYFFPGLIFFIIGVIGVALDMTSNKPVTRDPDHDPTSPIGYRVLAEMERQEQKEWREKKQAEIDRRFDGK